MSLWGGDKTETEHRASEKVITVFTPEEVVIATADPVYFWILLFIILGI